MKININYKPIDGSFGIIRMEPIKLPQEQINFVQSWSIESGYLHLRTTETEKDTWLGKHLFYEMEHINSFEVIE